MISESTKNIFFYWDGMIDDGRFKILEDCIYSTRVFNPNHEIILVTNSISQEKFDDSFKIKVYRWDNSLFENTPVPLELIEKYYTNCHPRERSDLIRLVLLYKYGGSYIDTDDIALKELPNIGNIICRSYDPHTCHYNKLKPEDCIPGKYREIRGYDHINIFPRNDCWLNFEPRHFLIKEILSNPKFLNTKKEVYIGDDFSWQSLTLEACLNNLDKVGIDFNIGLTLLYLYEDFVSASSFWDRCLYGGEMCDLYKRLPDIDKQEWGFYKCERKDAELFYKNILEFYPMLSHLWLHSKNMKEEWMLESLSESTYSLSTWIYDFIKTKIKQYKNQQTND